MLVPTSSQTALQKHRLALTVSDVCLLTGKRQANLGLSFLAKNEGSVGAGENNCDPFALLSWRTSILHEHIKSTPNARGDLLLRWCIQADMVAQERSQASASK